MAGLPALTYLNCHSCPISRVPKVLSPALVYINFSNCRIVDASPVFECCLMLEVLNLSSNNLECVKGIERLTKLTSLELQKNALNEIPNLKACNKLQVLNLDVFRSNNEEKIKSWIQNL